MSIRLAAGTALSLCAFVVVSGCGGSDPRIALTITPSAEMVRQVTMLAASIDVTISGADEGKQSFDARESGTESLFADGSERVYFLPRAEAQGSLRIEVVVRDARRLPIAVGRTERPLLRGEGAAVRVTITSPGPCDNEVKDTDEGDVDCGGTCARRCALGRTCGTNEDCADAGCVRGQCAPAACGNGVTDGDETALDCGGTCPSCLNGEACADAGDCRSGYCTDESACAACSESSQCADGAECAEGLCRVPGSMERPCAVANGTGSQTFAGNEWGACRASSCDADYHLSDGACASNSRTCVVNGGSGVQTWNGSGYYGPCMATGCPPGQHIENNACTSDTRACAVAHGIGQQTWNGAAYGLCTPTSCDSGYHAETTSCVENTRPCSVANGTGTQTWSLFSIGGGSSGYGACVATSCNAGFHIEGSGCASNTRTCLVANGAGSQTWQGTAYGPCVPTSCNGGFHIEGNACLPNTRSCAATPNGLGTQSWLGTAWGTCTLVSCYNGFAMQGTQCVPIVGACGDPAWQTMGVFTCEGGGVQRQRICACQPPGYSDPLYWLDEGGSCYSHLTGQSCTPGSPPVAGDCGPGWLTMGTFSCDAQQKRRQQICGCLPPLYYDPVHWNNVGGGCYEHATGESC